MSPRNSDEKLTLREVITLMRMDAEMMNAMMAERVAIYGSLDYTFFRWYYERKVARLRALEDVLNERDQV